MKDYVVTYKTGAGEIETAIVRNAFNAVDALIIFCKCDNVKVSGCEIHSIVLIPSK